MKLSIYIESNGFVYDSIAYKWQDVQITSGVCSRFGAYRGELYNLQWRGYM